MGTRRRRELRHRPPDRQAATTPKPSRTTRSLRRHVSRYFACEARSRLMAVARHHTEICCLSREATMAAPCRAAVMNRRSRLCWADATHRCLGWVCGRFTSDRRGRWLCTEHRPRAREGLIRLCGGPAPGHCFSRNGTVSVVPSQHVVVATQNTQGARLSFPPAAGAAHPYGKDRRRAGRTVDRHQGQRGLEREHRARRHLVARSGRLDATVSRVTAFARSQPSLPLFAQSRSVAQGYRARNVIVRRRRSLRGAGPGDRRQLRTRRDPRHGAAGSAAQRSRGARTRGPHRGRAPRELDGRVAAHGPPIEIDAALADARSWDPERAREYDERIAIAITEKGESEYARLSREREP